MRHALRFGCFSVSLALLSVAVSIRGAAVGLSSLKAELVAPGVWRIHFGNPEKFTPTHFRSAPMETAGLAAKPTRLPIPLNTGEISFQISDRGCSLRWPMEPGENIYGFGLHTELFEHDHRRVVSKADRQTRK